MPHLTKLDRNWRANPMNARSMLINVVLKDNFCSPVKRAMYFFYSPQEVRFPSNVKILVNHIATDLNKEASLQFKPIKNHVLMNNIKA